MTGLGAFFRQEEQQYVPFIAAAIVFGAVAGFPLGFTLAHAAAQGSSLGGHYPALVQVHGHLQLVGWVGLFVMGMGLRLVPRFTGARVRPRALVPLTLVLTVSGLLVRAFAQPFADERPLAVLFVAAAALEAAGGLTFCVAILRCLASGRREAFLYSPFFGAGAVWVAIAAVLSLIFVADAAQDSARTILAVQSGALAFMQLYGFVLMFVFAVSLRTFPIFFGRRPAWPQLTLAAWAVANVAVALYAATLIWKSYDRSADVRLVQAAAFLVVGAALFVLVLVSRVFEGTPHRLRLSARRSMRFVRSAYAWLLVAAGLHIFLAAESLMDGQPLTPFGTDAVRHFLALGFVTTMIIGMALLVLPRLAMRRGAAQPDRIVAPLILILLHGATAARGAGSLLVDEARIETGFWTMSAGGLAAVFAVVVFAVYLLWPSRPAEIPVTVRPG